MSATTSVDPVAAADLLRLEEQASGPRVSMYLPTHRAGRETRQGPIQLGNLISAAERDLGAAGLPDDDVDALLAPARRLVDDIDFWEHQADGLALFAASGVHTHRRVPLQPAAEATVAGAFRLRPLLPLLVGDGHFFLLTLSQNEVRLLEGTRTSIGEVDLGPIPASMAEALAHEDPEAQLQFRSGGDANFHGHGKGDEVDKAAVERFLRAVDRGLAERLGASEHPLVLAGVGYYGPIFRSVSRHPHVLEPMVEGNPEHRRPDELHTAAWEVVAPVFAGARQEALDRFEQSVGAGRTATDVVEVAVAAREGRIDSVFVDDGAAPDWARLGEAPHDIERVEGPGPDVVDLLDHVVAATLQAGGAVFGSDPEGPGLADPVAALLRY